MLEELDSFRLNYPDNFQLYHTVDVKPEESVGWKHGVGFVTKEMIKEKMPEPSPDTIILFCGPPPFEDMMVRNLKELNYTEDMFFKF